MTLAFDDRFRRRMAMTDDAGGAFLLDLPRAVALDDGDGLELGDGSFLRVVAAPEALMEVRVPGPAEAFARVAWHLGNRHLPVQIVGDTIRLRRDHVIEDMLRGLGAEVRDVEAPFMPEGRRLWRAFAWRWAWPCALTIPLFPSGRGEWRGVSAHALTRLLAWLSPSFPVGGFSYSHGIEAAVEQGLVRDRASLIVWLDGILRHGARADRRHAVRRGASRGARRGRGGLRLGGGAGRHPARLFRDGARIARPGAGLPAGDPRGLAARRAVALGCGHRRHRPATGLCGGGGAGVGPDRGR